jgi:hypothetical protein
VVSSQAKNYNEVSAQYSFLAHKSGAQMKSSCLATPFSGVLSSLGTRWNEPHILCRADAQTAHKRRLKGCRDDEVFSIYLPRPNATLFAVTRPLVHDAMSMLLPDRWIFIVKACRAFSYGRERACRLKSNIPRKIKSDGLLCKALAY